MSARRSPSYVLHGSSRPEQSPSLSYEGLATPFSQMAKLRLTGQVDYLESPGDPTHKPSRDERSRKQPSWLCCSLSADLAEDPGALGSEGAQEAPARPRPCASVGAICSEPGAPPPPRPAASRGSREGYRQDQRWGACPGPSRWDPSQCGQTLGRGLARSSCPTRGAHV